MTNTAIIPLINVLHNDSNGLRQFAVRRLVALGKPAIPALIELLGDPKEYTQESAAIALATMGKFGIPSLIDAMIHHPNRRIRWHAAWVLASMGAEARESIPAIDLPVRARKNISTNHGVWSDSWLTKIRKQLHENRCMIDLCSASAEVA